MRQQRRQHAKRTDQVRAPHDVGHRFGEHRMHSPERRQQQRRRHLFEDRHPQQVDQPDVQRVQQKIDPVIARGVGLAPQHRIIEHV